MPEVKVLAKKKKNCPRTEVDLKGSHIILSIDISDEESKVLTVPECMIDEIIAVNTKFGTSKIQFGVTAEYQKEDGETKTWQISNSAVKFSDEFIENGILKLHEKIVNYTELSSGWSLVRFLEITMTITKFHEIINRSGIIFK